MCAGRTGPDTDPLPRPFVAFPFPVGWGCLLAVGWPGPGGIWELLYTTGDCPGPPRCLQWGRDTSPPSMRRRTDMRIATENAWTDPEAGMLTLEDNQGQLHRYVRGHRTCLFPAVEQDHGRLSEIV